MEKHKKKVLILVGVILAFISFLAILFSLLFKDEKDKKPSTEPNGNSSLHVISKEIEKLTDENVFFSLQNTINNYYEMISNKETFKLLNILDSDFIKAENINSVNIYNILGSNLQSVSYVIKNIYYNPNSSITYYFINGYFTNVSILDDDDFSEYIPNLNYLIVVDSDNKYVIKPLDKNIDIKEYAKAYSIIDKDINSNETLVINNTSEKNKLSIYIGEFLNLMFYDSERAYNMLDNETKKLYSNSKDFENHIMDIYNKLSISIFAFSSKEITGEKVYDIIDDKQNKIILYEKGVMDYKIQY